MLNSPPATALARILHGQDAVPSPAVIVLDYGNRAVFRDLWLNGLSTKTPTIDGIALDWRNGNQQILIIGNDTPEDIFKELPAGLQRINFRSHLTATSWLAAWKVKFTPSEEDRKNGKKEAPARIAVIDPREANLSRGAACALQTILAARDSECRTLVPHATVLNAPSLERICHWLRDSKADTRETAVHIPGILRASIWNGLTSTSETHHAISNILGPLILSGKPESPEPCLNTVLRRLLRACGLVSWSSCEPPGEGQGGQPRQTTGAAIAEEEGEDLQILLLDDQAEAGWVDWVKEILPKAETLQYLTDPTILVEAISRALRVQDGKPDLKDARFCLTLPKLDEVAKPVLLLDLRLFSGKPEAERKFYGLKLLSLVNYFTDKDELAWPGFSSDNRAFRQAREKVEKNELAIDTDDHHEVLTWLPRVVALADMSLPIILFSSTGRRDLVEPFKAFGNIITCFEKPRLNDLVSRGDTVADTRITAKTRLLEAIRRAREWLRFRSFAACAVADPKPIVPSLRCSGGSNDPVKHYEIYLDESGSSRDDGFRIAALAVGYRDNAHAEATARTMQDRGVSWFGEKGRYCYDKDIARGACDIQRLGEKFAPELRGLWVLPLILWSNSKDDQVASDTFNADTLIQSMVGEAMELCLFLLLPRDSDSTYKVYGAQRRIEVKGADFAVDKETPAGAETATVSFSGLVQMGVEIPAEKKKVIDEFRRIGGVAHDRMEYSVQPFQKKADGSCFTKLRVKVTFLSISSAQDYGSILARTFQTRPWDDARRQLGRRITPGFAPLNQPERASLAEGCRPIHIVADFLPGNATWDATGAKLGASAEMLPNNGSPAPVLVVEGAELSRLLAIGRALDGGDYAQALANGASLDHTLQSHAQPLYQAVYCLITFNIGSLKGTHLVDAAHYLDAAPLTRNGALPFARVQLRHQHWTHYPKPDPVVIEQLQDYCKDKLIVDFGVAPDKLEACVAQWELDQAITAAYPDLGMTTAQWMKDMPTQALFAIVTFSPEHECPFRRASSSVPPVLRLDGDAKPLVINFSMGPVPVGRLRMNGGEIEWIEAMPATLPSKGWTPTQCKAVSASGLQKFGPLSFREVAQVSRILKMARWNKAMDDRFTCYASQPELDDLKPHLRKKISQCGVEDFSPTGEFLHDKGSWPASPNALEMQTNTRSPVREQGTSGGTVGPGHRETWPLPADQTALRSKSPKELSNDTVCILRLPAQTDARSISEALNNKGFRAQQIVLKRAAGGGKYALAVIGQTNLSAALAALHDGIDIGTTRCRVAQAFKK